MLATVRPVVSTMAIAPRWRLSTSGPRVTSTRTGFVISGDGPAPVLQPCRKTRDAGVQHLVALAEAESDDAARRVGRVERRDWHRRNTGLHHHALADLE